ncbi:CatB-related O-acetyltransferase [Rhodococcus sp. SGAir0479]|uniref:CatB-related O-acetyltransferase n=1 Tax=Rhodococcus sp. SGAir0479 TaxID=2567884 RepID=UPI00267177B9|nr:CatB-related O-acetyltransferase [Rhodococcus sp. SGAir0479]
MPKLVTFDYDDTSLSIGNFTSIGGNVTVILGGNHRLDRATTFPLRQKLGLDGAGSDGYPWSKGTIEIGSDVWIGYGATILSGVTIGDGSVVAAGSVVSRSVAPYTVVAGSPAKPVRMRMEVDLIDRFLAVAWWDWPDSEIMELAGPLSDLPPAEAIDILEEHARLRSAR